MAGPANAVYTTFYDAAPRGATPSTKAWLRAMPCHAPRVCIIMHCAKIGPRLLHSKRCVDIILMGVTDSLLCHYSQSCATPGPGPLVKHELQLHNTFNPRT